MLKKLSLIVLYLSFAVVLTAFLLVIRFPKDSVVAFVISKIEQTLVGYTCGIKGLEYRFPYSLYLEELTLTHQDSHVVLPLQNLLLSADRKSIFKRCRAQFEIFSGDVQSEILFKPSDLTTVELSDLVVTGIDIGKIEVLRNYVDRNVAGVFTFTGNYIGKLGAFDKGSLTGMLEMINFQLELKRSVLMSNSVEFDEIKMLVKFREGKLTLTDGQAKGTMYDTDFEGQIEKGPLVQESSVAITGRLSPRQEYIQNNRQVARAAALLYKKYKNTSIPYLIRGSLREPFFQFGGSGEFN